MPGALVVATLGFLALVAAVGHAASDPAPSLGSPQIVFEWNWLNFTFPSTKMYAAYIEGGYYMNCMLAGVKVSMTGQYFVSVPRWKPGVPATLSRIVSSPFGNLLQPFPSWAMNSVGVDGAFQSVLGFEIDATNTLWVLDQGKVAGAAAIPNSIKLVAIDLNTTMVSFTYSFPESVASLNGSFLNDLVVDLSAGFVYITDSGLPLNASTGSVDGGLIVYSVAKKYAWRVLSSTTFTNDVEGLWISIGGELVLSSGPMRTGADGIALSPDMSTLVFCPLTSTALYSIPTAVLRNVTQFAGAPIDAAFEAAIEAAIQVTVGRTFSSDGLGMSNASVLYATSLQNSSVFQVTALEPSFGGLAVAVNASAMVWPDTIGWDHAGSLVFTTNQLLRFVQGELVFANVSAVPGPASTGPAPANFRIWSVYVGADSYLAGVFPPASPPPPSASSHPNVSRLVRIYVLVGLVLVCIVAVLATLACGAICNKNYTPIMDAPQINMPEKIDKRRLWSASSRSSAY